MTHPCPDGSGTHLQRRCRHHGRETQVSAYSPCSTRGNKCLILIFLYQDTTVSLPFDRSRLAQVSVPGHFILAYNKRAARTSTYSYTRIASVTRLEFSSAGALAVLLPIPRPSQRNRVAVLRYFRLASDNVVVDSVSLLRRW